MSNNDKSKKTQSGDKKDKKPYDFGGIIDYKLEDIEAEVLNDNVYLDVFAGSDARFKQNIEGFSGGLGVISKLGVYKYLYNKTQFTNKNFPSDAQVGVMAQELEAELPHLVAKDEEGYRYVNYAGLSPVLVSAVKELSEIVEKQSQEIKFLEERLKKLEK